MATETGTGTKWVYEFSEGSRDMRELLGGKGANVAEMTRVLGAERVPAGFTITTEACVAYMREDGFPDGLDDQIAEALGQLEEQAGKKLGDTAPTLGLNDDPVEGLAKQTDSERCAWAPYRRFVQMYANVVKGVEGEKIE